MKKKKQSQMAEEKRKKTTAEKIAELKKRIIGCKDAKLTESLINELLALHKQSLHEPTELIVPVKEVKDTIDFGHCKISRTIRGYLYEAKGGLYTFVESRMASVCAMCDTIFEIHGKDDLTEEDRQLYDSFVNAVQYVFQTPIFASMNEGSLFSIATEILRVFNDYCAENYTNAEGVEETEEDIKANNEFEQMGQAIESLANAPLPPEEQEN